MLAPYIKSYIIHGLRSAPNVIEVLLKDAKDPDFDRRPDPNRFTIREVVAHLADWEGVWLARADRIVTEDHPRLESYDEGQWAIDHEYSKLHVAEQLAKFRVGRSRLADYLESLSAEQWQREGVREFGPITIFEQTSMILGHDGYHMAQIIEWLADSPKGGS